MTELYKKHRPKLLKNIVGQLNAVRTLKGMGQGEDRFPHSILFTGPSGCGKTTLARIVASKLGCSPHDLHEINSADFRGIDTVRDIRNRIGLAPMGGRCRVWIVDEVHQLSSPAQHAMLKILEETPKHVYFILATTDPEKLLKTVRNRCCEIALVPLHPSQLRDLLQTICRREKLKITEEVEDRIIEIAEGSARQALVLLDKIAPIKDEEEQLDTLARSSVKEQAIEIARKLINPRATWKEVAALLKGVDEEPESLRWMILGFASTVMLSGNPKTTPRALLMIEAFRDNFYDSKRAGLIAACYEVVKGG